MNGGQGPPREHDGRRYERFRVKVPVFIAVDGGTFRKTIHLESRDVSAGGLCFETSRQIPLNAKSKVVVSKIGDVGDPALIQGRVAYCDQDPTTGRYRVGLEFLEFVNVTQEQLRVHVETWAREGAPQTPSD